MRGWAIRRGHDRTAGRTDLPALRDTGPSPSAFAPCSAATGAGPGANPVTLRDGGTSWDVGYVRAVQRPDGKVVAVYYFTDEATGPERYIGATIWSPPPA